MNVFRSLLAVEKIHIVKIRVAVINVFVKLAFLAMALTALRVELQLQTVPVVMFITAISVGHVMKAVQPSLVP